MSGLPSLRAVLLMIAVVVAVSVIAAGVALTARKDLFAADPPPARQTPAARKTQTQTTNLDKIVPKAEPVKDFGQGGPAVTSTPPKILAIARAEVPKQARFKLSALKNVQKLTVVDAGSVRVSGTGLNLLAVNPADFRAWTPKAVADQPAVWNALARGELVAETATVRRYGMILGAEYQVDNGPRLRVAASAALGLAGIDGLVSADLGKALGLAPGVAVLLHGKAAIGEKGVRGLLGKGAQVVTLGARPRKQQPRQTARPQQQVNVGRPNSYLDLYKASATHCPGLSWTVLAAIGQVESGHGRNNGPSSAGALGPMQFMPATWKHYGVDGDGDGKADIWSPYDAVPAAAKYLCANGAGRGGEKLRKSIWFYNHSWDYVNKVMGIAEAYARAYA
ncbi:lytic transglycosylase domain-containing protein [Nonomuraea rhizosphaerae]|uniref:lytic transglycosylase domain-containing protein n=1 Tax=Nonomuraea rhizosphaerae TaxID=2665663 RepID=UPI0027E389EF|nr:lytic transglycosylase domain-containing protein [Nonomuraea rhizosphaerae]